MEARWTKKNEQSHFGCKNQISVDVKHKFIRRWRVTASTVHDSRVFFELLAVNTSREVWADSAYFSEESLERLEASGYRPHIQGKGQKNHPLSEWEKPGNRRRSRIRCRVEHVFGAQQARAGMLLVGCIGLLRARAKRDLRNLAYNMDRLGFLAGAR